MVQKSITKDVLNQVMERYGCSEEDAIRACLEAENSYEEALDSMLGEDSGTKAKEAPLSHTPMEIKTYLDKFVIGQETYKKRLAIAAAYHFATVKAKHDNLEAIRDFNVKRFRKKNTLIAGPSGSGKTYCVEVLADLLGVPVNIVDATDYTEAGYVGKSADDMVRELIAMAPGDSKSEKADFINRYGGLIFVDEVDKKAKDGSHAGADVSREGFQRAVLKLIERKAVSIDDPNSPASQIQGLVDQQRGISGKKKDTMLGTENILFVLGGSFQRAHDSMEAIVKKRMDSKSGKLKEDGSLNISGFASPSNDSRHKEFRNYYKDAIDDDYIRFGLIPELVGRTPIRTYVNALSKNDLVRIMTNTEDSILNQYKMEFTLFNIDIDFASDAIEKVAEKAEAKKTGARALVSEWESILTDFQFQLPGHKVSAFTVTKKICEHPQDELLKILEKSPVFDFADRFRQEHGVQLRFTDESVGYIENYAKKNGMQVSDALGKLMAGAPALNYMNHKGEFVVEPKALKDEKYFDNLYVEWHKKQIKDQPLK